ncbi:hypothetical protein C8F04DRAFT_1198556 [Mycena alexandri]|uniref:Uncharacterized protein n=1 Tax=Mycena alexandri TaxID=1745969 RepID=A0AAD6S025_9AGAR|nr:hypothetical protein C8F04DRAFT_1198556 [Mycena alexandri]
MRKTSWSGGRVLARTHKGKARTDNTVKGLAREGLLCRRVFSRHEVVWIPRQWYRARKYQHGNRLVRTMEIVGGKDGVWDERIACKENMARKEGHGNLADRVNEGGNRGGNPFWEGTRKWSSLRKEAVIPTSNSTPRMSRLATEGRKVAWGPHSGFRGRSVDCVDGDSGGRKIIGPGQRWVDRHGFRRQIVDIITVFVERPDGKDSPARVVSAESRQPNELIAEWWRWGGAVAERMCLRARDVPPLQPSFSLPSVLPKISPSGKEARCVNVRPRMRSIRVAGDDICRG